MKITLDDEIEAAQSVVKMYRNSWFMPYGAKKQRWAGEEGQWREWLAANAILRRLKKLRRRR